TTRLVYKTIKSYKNKYFAIKDLDANNEEIKKLEANVNFMDYINGVLPVDLMMSANEMLAYSNKLNRPWRHPVFNDLDQTPHYVGTHLKLYAEEDDLDQPICKLAGVDLI